MKVTICCKRYGPSGGAEKFLANFVRYLVDGGHQVKIIAAEVTAEPREAEIQRLWMPPVPRVLQDWALARVSRAALADDTADVTFSDQKCWGAHVVRPGGGVQREYLKQRAKSPPTGFARAVYRLQHALSVRDRLRVHIDDVLYAPPGPRLVIANSGMVRRNLCAHYPHLAGRIRVVYNGADPELFHPGLRLKHRGPTRERLGIPADALVVVFVGTGWERKGLYTLVRALGIIAAAGAEPPFAIIVGQGRQRYAARFAARHGVRGQLRFTGPAEPNPYYGASDLLVLPSFFDPCANVTLEALACGLPVVTSSYNGAYELLTPGEDGFYVRDAADAQAVAGYMQRFADPEFLALASGAARRLALKHTLERQYEQMLDAICSVACG